jgi:hypothetical protein
LLTVVDTPTCTDPGCGAAAASACGYLDRFGRTCPSAWCETHQVLVGTRAYCRRHAPVIAALLKVPQDQRVYPELANRAPSLVQWMGEEMHQAFVDMLAHYQQFYPDSVSRATELEFALTGMPRMRGWERGWTLGDHTGPRLSIYLRVEEENDSVLLMRVNGKNVLREVPPWILEREAPSPAHDEYRRAVFRHQVITAAASAAAELIRP